MKIEERQNRILAILRAMQREIRVEELAEMMDVSSLTIRRDLDQLSSDKTIIRTHGGCLSVGRAALETEYHKKVGLNFDLKQAIGREASTLLEDGDSLLLNDGSTTFHLATHLGSDKKLTVFTNSLAMITEISRFSNVQLFILGGKYSDTSYSLRGSLLEQVLENYTFDKVFLGADAIDEKGRCMVSTTEEARLTRFMLDSGRMKILLADHTKTSADGHCAYGSLSDFDIWITTHGLDRSIYPAKNSQVNIRIAGGLP